MRENIEREEGSSRKLAILRMAEIDPGPVVDCEALRLFWVGWDAPVYGPTSWSSLEFANDVNPVRHEERVPQQAPKHSHGIEHRIFFAVAHVNDDHLAGVLSRPGQR
jgi:hypothetical protein